MLSFSLGIYFLTLFKFVNNINKYSHGSITKINKMQCLHFYLLHKLSNKFSLIFFISVALLSIRLPCWASYRLVVAP